MLSVFASPPAIILITWNEVSTSLAIGDLDVDPVHVSEYLFSQGSGF